MYTSLCIKDFEGCKRGDFFDTYEETKYTYVRKEDGNSGEFIKILSREFKTYFWHTFDAVFVPHVVKETTFKFFSIKLTKDTDYDEFYNFDFDLETKYLRRIQREVIYPIHRIKDRDFLKNFSTTLNYTLGSLVELAKMHKDTDVDLDAEITRAASYCSELETLYFSANKLPRLQVTHMLEEHHTHMDAIVKTMKEMNKQ
ncbi:hypothetical protein [Bacillus sp. NEAU-Y102]